MFFAFALLGSVIFLDMVLSGDNAIVVAMAANALPKAQRDVAITFGMALAAACRIVFACAALTLLAYHFIAFLGGFVLLYVAYQLGRDLLAKQPEVAAAPSATTALLKAIGLITLADISMSLDNVLAVAAMARSHPVIMVLGILASIAMLAFLARWVANLMDRHKWISWIGLCLIVWVAIDLIVGNYDATFALIRS